MAPATRRSYHSRLTVSIVSHGPAFVGAFRRALELNPDLQMAHQLLAPLDVDRGRAHDAMTRLLARGLSADPDVLAGLVMACHHAPPG